ncbi:MAG: VOC family protein [Pseudomonadota bacterium]
MVVVKRIVADLAAEDVAAVRQFYQDLFGLDVAMDFGWIATLTTGGSAPVQLSIASEGGSGTVVPTLSIEVDDVDEAHARAVEMGCDVPYPLTHEPWGVRRFFVKDPAGNTLNVLMHTG